MRGRLLPTTFLLILAFSAAAASAQTEAAELNTNAVFEQLLADEWEARLESSPLFATYAGDHRANDRLDDVSEAATLREAERDRGFLGRLDAIERGALTAANRLSYDLFRVLLENRLGEIEHHAYLIPITNRDGFHVRAARLPQSVPLSTVADYDNYIARLRALPKYFRQHMDLLRRGIELGMVLPRVVLEGFSETIAAHVVDDPAESVFYAPFEDLPPSIHEATAERLTSDGRAAIRDAAVPAFREFLDFFDHVYLPACRDTIGAADLPGGRAFYEHRVRRDTTLDVSPEEVHEIGLAEVARIRGEMEAILEEVAFEGDFAAFLEFLRTDPRFYAKTPEELMKEAAWIAKRMDGALPRFFGRLPRLPYGLEPIPDYLAPKTTGAYYSQGAADGTRAGSYFLNTYNLASRPLYVLESLTFHEAVPGHHLQIALQQELEGLPPFRRFFELGVFVEGWALDSERLGLEAGFYQDPYSNFGRLTYERWRACRLVVDTGLHALGWSRQRAIDFLAGHTALSIHEVTTEIDRYIAWPGQALGYKMGELEIRRLREQAEETLGERFDVREFHDRVLENGALPLEVLRGVIEEWLAEKKK